MNRRRLTVIRLIAAAVWITAIVTLLLHRDSFTAENLAAMTPENPVAAGIVLVLLYACKSVVIFFPIKVLQLSAGILFSLPMALLVNFAGCALSVCVGYAMGRLLGADAVQKLTQKNRRLSVLLSFQNGGILVFSLFLRFLIFLPLETVSMYFGASKARFPNYFLGSMLGLTPNIIFSTWMGEGLTDLHAPSFWIAFAVYAVLSLLSAGMYILYLRRLRRLRNLRRRHRQEQ